MLISVRGIYKETNGNYIYFPYVPYIIGDIASYKLYAVSGYFESGINKWNPQISSTILSIISEIIMTFEYTKTT